MRSELLTRFSAVTAYPFNSGFLFQKSYHYQALLKAFFRKATAGLSASDTKEVNAAMGVIANEKLKVEREAAAGKKKGGG